MSAHIDNPPDSMIFSTTLNGHSNCSFANDSVGSGFPWVSVASEVAFLTLARHALVHAASPTGPSRPHSQPDLSLSFIEGLFDDLTEMRRANGAVLP